VVSLLRLLTQITADRATLPAALVPHICQLLLNQLLPLVQEAPADLMPKLLDLIGSLLTDHWRCFVVVENPGLGSGPPVKRFASNEMQDYFNRMMEVKCRVALPANKCRSARLIS
jgi:hypothetical protein